MEDRLLCRLVLSHYCKYRRGMVQNHHHRFQFVLKRSSHLPDIECIEFDLSLVDIRLFYISCTETHPLWVDILQLDILYNYSYKMIYFETYQGGTVDTLPPKN